MGGIILGIETSCDETSAAVVAGGREVLSNVVSGQDDLHARYGGVVPEIAARAHVERIDGVIRAALDDARLSLAEVDALAVADGPGLIGSLLVGVTAAKTLAVLLGKPLIAVDHIHAHAVSAALTSQEPEPWPAVALVVSGGHTTLYDVPDPLTLRSLGETHDDAAGEAFDKVAAILGLGYPGGPRIEQAAASGDPAAYAFPRTWIDEPHCDFSYSGLKTAVLYAVHGQGNKYGDASRLDARVVADVAASFQAAAVAPLVVKTLRAVGERGARHVLVGGGVAANALLRKELESGCAGAGVSLHLTPLRYCTDNAAMIAALGWRLWRAGRTAPLTLEPRAGLVRRARSA